MAKVVNYMLERTPIENELQQYLQGGIMSC